MGKKRKSLCRRRRLPRGAIEASESRDNNAMPFDLISGKFIPEKSNIWRDCVDGYYDWVKEHIAEGAPLDEGADIEQRGVTKETPLNRAAHNGHLQTVMFLVEKGADVNCLDLGENTPLYWAAMRGHVEIVKYLLECGADRNMRNKQDKVPMDLCRRCSRDEWACATPGVLGLGRARTNSHAPRKSLT